MRTPVHTPLSVAAACERLADILVLLEITPGAALRLTPLAVRRLDQSVEACIIAVLPDGGREALSIDDALRLARILREVGSFATAKAQARELAQAAALAESYAALERCSREIDLAGWIRRHGEGPSRRRAQAVAA